MGGEGSSKLKRVVYVVAGLAAVTAVLLLGRQAGPYVEQFSAWVQGLGAWAPAVFILGYIVATVAFVPGSALTLAAGFIFGVPFGTLYTFVGATLGAAAAFLVARYMARGAIERRIEGNAKFAAVDRAVGREGFKIVALLRLSPVFPFNLLNYSLGLTRVRFRDYLAASVAMLPGTLLYVFYGATARKAADTLAEAEVQKGVGSWVLFGVGLVATVVATAYVTRLARRALARELEAPASEGEPSGG